MTFKISYYFFVLCLILQTPLLHAQSSSYTDDLKSEQENLVKQLHQSSIDSNIISGISQTVNLKIDSIRIFILFNDALSPDEKEKAIKSHGSDE